MAIEVPEKKIVDRYHIACDGGEGPLGHPRVWLQVPPKTGWVKCPYCDCKYIHRDYIHRDHQDTTT
ncbi:MAG: zinc-finger domain-containing protein [Rhodobacteraceae bacterium]|nr:zinc-finger domain-containing protein [Paracoccaceae bacterium]